MAAAGRTVRACWLGTVPYETAWQVQRSLVEEVRAGRQPATLLLLEHPHVFTLGRRGTVDHVLWDEPERRRRDVQMVFTDRGGDATYHGPGQLVGYPVLDLRRHGGDVVAYVRRLEASLIDYLATISIQAGPVPGLTGVWAADAKVAAIGVKLSESVVSHGFALNLTTDLDYFSGIVPCGLPDRAATSVHALGGAPIPVADAARAYARSFERVFGVTLAWETLPSLPSPGAAPVPPRDLSAAR